MKQGLILAAASFAMLSGFGCANRYASAPPPPPPSGPVYNQVPPNIQLADQNGFRDGERDGARDAYEGRPYRARSTRAYFDTPGFDGNLGPFPPYQNSFRLAYLRGYDKGFRHA